MADNPLHVSPTPRIVVEIEAHVLYDLNGIGWWLHCQVTLTWNIKAYPIVRRQSSIELNPWCGKLLINSRNLSQASNEFYCSLWVKLPTSLCSLLVFITKKYLLRKALEHWVQFVMLFSGSAPNHLHAFPFSEKGKTISPMYFLLVLGWLTVSHNLKNLLKCLMERSVEHVEESWGTRVWIQK